MAHTSRFDRGAIVTHLNPNAVEPTVFLRSVVTVAHVVDPDTGRVWVAVLRPDRTLFVLDAANIIDAVPSDDHSNEPGCGPSTPDSSR
ncbi:hypothetical protein [Actinophytocola sp.]|uniref:hypothetical protein n=1 Tax=Actinophytocola sp. TaxID=1872138 RepID=UPI003899D3B1